MLWRVWSTTPAVPNVVSENFRDGWLTFDSTAGRRRLAPIPKGWETAEAERLELWLKVAEPMRRSPPFGISKPRIEDEAK